MSIDSVALTHQAFKDKLRRLVADNRLANATELLLKAAGGEEYGSYRTRVLHQSGQLTAYQELLILGTEAPAELARNRNQLSVSLLQLIDDLPDAAAIAAGEKKLEGVSEHRLKNQLFGFLLAGKIIVVFFAAFLWLTGSMTAEHFLTVIGIIVPVFATYLALMVQDATNRRSVLQPGDKRVNKGFARMARILVILYPLVLILLLNLAGPGTITIAQLIGLLALLETGLGAYLGKLLFGLFRGE